MLSSDSFKATDTEIVLDTIVKKYKGLNPDVFISKINKSTASSLLISMYFSLSLSLIALSASLHLSICRLSLLTRFSQLREVRHRCSL